MMSRATSAVRLALLVPAVLQLCGCAAVVRYLVPRAPTAGQSVRVFMTDSNPPLRTGRLVALTDDSLVLERDSARSLAESGAVAGRLALALDGVDEIDVSQGMHRNLVSGVLIGGVIGSLGGLTVLCLRIGDCLGHGERDLQASTIMLVAVGAGVAVGGTIGVFVRSERWDEVPLSVLHRVRVDPLTPSALRLQAGLRLYPALLGRRGSSRRQCDRSSADGFCRDAP
jgi:hypothetical protein